MVALLDVLVGIMPCPKLGVLCAGSNCPSILPMHQQRELCQLSVAAVKCMGFTVGVFHVECKYTSQNGPQLIEVSSSSQASLTGIWHMLTGLW